MKVGIIGGGPAALCAIKYCIAEGFEVIAFEQSQEIGGEWYSTLEIGPHVHSKIYENLRANVPKEAMAFADFPYDESIEESFLTPDKVFDYFQAYADAFDLRKHINLQHRVTRVRPIGDEWEIIVDNLRSGEQATFMCDAVFTCAGITAPWMPKYEGREDFQGRVIHTQDYRSSKPFAGEKVLLIGSGLSALDLVLDISTLAERLTWVQKVNEKHGASLKLELSSNVVQKSAIKRLTRSGAVFSDDSEEEFTVIIYATGYDKSYPFLSVDSGISVYDKCVYPLYKHCINANRTSLAMISLPHPALSMPMYELQIKFCLQFWSKRRNFPSREQMLQDIREDFERRNVQIDVNNHSAHYLGGAYHEAYYESLAEASGIEPIKPVFAKILNHFFAHAFDDFRTFRQLKYRILNDFEFSCSCTEKVLK